MIQTPEEIMKQFANDHSYETWGELMYDCHEHSQIQYTKEVMIIYAKLYSDEETLKLINDKLKKLHTELNEMNETLNKTISYVKNDKNDKK